MIIVRQSNFGAKCFFEFSVKSIPVRVEVGTFDRGSVPECREHYRAPEKF